MKIDNSINKTAATGPVSGTPAKAGKSDREQRSPGQSGESVQLSPLSSQLQSIESSLAATDVVDPAKVEKIKQAISEGRLQVNPGAIADRLLDTVKDMLRAQKAH